MDLIEGSETSEIINQTPGNYPKESLLYSVHGESLKSRNGHRMFTRIILFSVFSMIFFSNLDECCDG